MKTYLVILKHNAPVRIQAQGVKVLRKGTLIFYNKPKNLTERLMYGPDIVAAFPEGSYNYYNTIIKKEEE